MSPEEKLVGNAVIAGSVFVAVFVLPFAYASLRENMVVIMYLRRFQYRWQDRRARRRGKIQSV